MGDATSKAGQSPVGHTLCTEETAAASRACRGMRQGWALRLRSYLLPAHLGMQDAQRWAAGRWGKGLQGQLPALTRGIGRTLVVNDLAGCCLLPRHQHHILIPAHLVEGCGDRAGDGAQLGSHSRPQSQGYKQYLDTSSHCRASPPRLCPHKGSPACPKPGTCGSGAASPCHTSWSTDSMRSTAPTCHPWL